VLAKEPKPENRVLACAVRVILEHAPFITFMSLVFMITEQCILISPNTFRMNFR
jgi:hypothetical protein